jgi:hypothetical protein
MAAHPVVEVEWHDAFTSGLHWAADHAVEPALIRSVGYWLCDFPLDGYMTLAQSAAADDQTGELLHIPEPMVQSRRILHMPTKRRRWLWLPTDIFT